MASADWCIERRIGNALIGSVARLGKGIRPGPESYLFWNDGDPAFLQAIWCLIRRLNAAKVVETGVAHGVTSRIILEALNGRGHLWSIDLPPVWAPDVHREIGAAVGDRPPDQWSLIFGSSRRTSGPGRELQRRHPETGEASYLSRPALRAFPTK